MSGMNHAVVARTFLAIASFITEAPYVQGQPAVKPSFEVASVKPAPPPDVMRSLMTGGPGTVSPGEFRCRSITLRALLLRAYSLMPYALDGPAGVLDGPAFDISAKIPSGATASDVNIMLQRLLLERFGLAVHWETREHAVYELTLAKGGLKMQEAVAAPAGGTPGDAPSLIRDGQWVLPAGAPAMVSQRATALSAFPRVCRP
jgi:uncharacterized protein (TIGR03435 family)